MAMANAPRVTRERVLIIMDEPQAKKVAESIVQHSAVSQKKVDTRPTEARIARATVSALQMIFKRPEGWYDAELRASLSKLIRPRLTLDELNRVMESVYVAVPRLEENPRIEQLRLRRRAASHAAKT